MSANVGRFLRRAWTLLDHLGRAITAWAIGGSLILTALLSWLLYVLNLMPWPVLAALTTGLFLVFFAALALSAPHIVARFPSPSQTNDNRVNSEISDPNQVVTQWESLVDAAATETITFRLRALSLPQMTRGLACDVRAPRTAFPVRAILRKHGLTVDEHVHYPENFPDADPVSAGTYQVTWYEADARGEWREILRASHDVTPGDTS